MNYRNKKVEEIIRVDHAGEYGAVRIYHGQMKAFAKKGDFEILVEIEKMKQQEQEHLKFFNKQLIERDILSTTFLPLWHLMGYSLGYVSARIGKDFAMTCTEAVEDVINRHYLSQIEFLERNNDESDSGNYKNLAENLEKFRLEELEHKDYAANSNNIELNSRPIRAKLNKLFGNAVKIGCKVAIAISKKI